MTNLKIIIPAAIIGLALIAFAVFKYRYQIFGSIMAEKIFGPQGGLVSQPMTDENIERSKDRPFKLVTNPLHQDYEVGYAMKDGMLTVGHAKNGVANTRKFDLYKQNIPWLIANTAQGNTHISQYEAISIEVQYFQDYKTVRLIVSEQRGAGTPTIVIDEKIV